MAQRFKSAQPHQRGDRPSQWFGNNGFCGFDSVVVSVFRNIICAINASAIGRTRSAVESKPNNCGSLAGYYTRL